MSIRVPVTKADSIAIFARDAWTCRYCNDAVFFSPALKVLDKINPGHGYYHAHGKTGSMLDVFQWKWASVDHVIPVSHGGQNILNNYVTACWKCNLTLNDKYADKNKTVLLNDINKNMGWDGFSGLYLQLGPKDSWHKILAMYARVNLV